MTRSVGVHDAKTHLSRLLAEVENGLEVVITRRGAEVARLVPPRRTAVRRFGVDRGRFEVPDDFDAPLTDEVLAEFEAQVLLDTHVFLWLQTTPERLGDHLATLQDDHTQLFVSAASAWEIAIKYGLGRLALPEPPASYVPERVRAIDARALAVEHAHALAVAELPPIHRDPFDRLLVAQARALGVPVMTADAVVASYPVESILVA